MNFPEVNKALDGFVTHFLAQAIDVKPIDNKPDSHSYVFENGTTIYIHRDIQTKQVISVTTGDGDCYNLSGVDQDNLSVCLAEVLLSIYTWDILDLEKTIDFTNTQ